VLEASEIGSARLLVVTAPDMVTARTVIANARRYNGELNVVARTSDTAFLPVFKELGVNSVVLPEFEASLEMTRKALLYFAVPVTEIQNRTESLRQDLFAPSFDEGDGYKTLAQLRSSEQRFDLKWVLLPADSPLVNCSIGRAGIRKKVGASVVGIIRNEKLIASPDAEFSFEVNDLVAIIGTEEARESFRAMAREKTTIEY
jgi:CPA2 family monovalent cation:H+ antiporter-2